MSNFEEAVLDIPGVEKKEIVFDESMSFEEYIKEQLRESLSDPNMYFAGLELGHKPNADEAMVYYVEHGGAENFKQRNLCHRSDLSREVKENFYFKNKK